MSARWPLRLAVLAGVVLILFVVLSVLDYEPRLGPLALLVAVCVAVGWLATDVLGDLGPDWVVPSSASTYLPGQDPRLTSYLRIIEGQATADLASSALRDRLAELVDARLARRHGLDRIDPEGRERIGAELLAVLEGPPRRLDYPELDRHVRRIEEL